MIGEPIVPDKLSEYIGNEEKDFVVRASRAQPFKSSAGTIIFGLLWLGFSSIFAFAFIGPLFAGKEVHFYVNEVPAVASPDNLDPVILPAIIIGLFVMIGIVMSIYGFYGMFKPGGYYVGTRSRLIHYYKGDIRSIDWEQFSGDITVGGTAVKGNITLGMRTGRMVSRKNGPDRYVPDILYLSGIEEAGKIEKICRQRIKENDPTPPSVV